MLTATIIATAKRLLWLAILGSCLHGCSSTRVHSKVDDPKANMISGTLVIRPESWRSDSERRGQSGIEVGYEHQSGKGTQSLKLNEYVQYDADTQLNGPQKISHDVSVDHAHIAYNRLMSYGDYFQLEPSVGIAHDEVNIDSSGIGTVLSNNTVNGNAKIGLRQTLTGLTVGIIPRWNFNHYFAFEIPVRIGVGFSSRTESVNGTFSNRNNGITEMINPSLVFSPSKNISLSVGYVDREQHVETDIAKSNLDLSFTGVSAAIRVIF